MRSAAGQRLSSLEAQQEEGPLGMTMSLHGPAEAGNIECGIPRATRPEELYFEDAKKVRNVSGDAAAASSSDDASSRPDSMPSADASSSSPRWDLVGMTVIKTAQPDTPALNPGLFSWSFLPFRDPELSLLSDTCTVYGEGLPFAPWAIAVT